MRAKDIKLSEIDIAEENVRKLHVEKHIDELARSIEAQGLIQPITVIFEESTGKYKLITGQRRFLAFKKLNRDVIPAIVAERELSASQKQIISLVENVQRADIDPQDRANAILALHSYNLSFQEISERVGFSEPTIRTWGGYDAVYSAIKDLVSDGKLNQTQAMNLFRATDDRAENGVVELAIVISELPSSKDKSSAIEILKNDPSLSLREFQERIGEIKQEEPTHSIILEFSGRSWRKIKALAKKRKTSPREFAQDLVLDQIEGL